ncbi:MAG: S8 family serine peptidase [Acidobacteriota bacterium]|nr:S8 family serine peptidase [Acidobacteriota bacterium]
MSIYSLIQLRVLNLQGRPLSRAVFHVKPAQAGIFTRLRGRYDKDLGTYFLRMPEFRRGEYVLRVSASGLESQERAVTFCAAGYSGEFVLAKEGTPYWMLGERKMPYVPEPRAVGLLIGRRLTEADRRSLLKRAGKRGLKFDEGELDGPRLLTRMVRRRRDGTDSSAGLEEELADLSGVQVLRDGIRMGVGEVLFPARILVSLREKISVEELQRLIIPFPLGVINIRGRTAVLDFRRNLDDVGAVYRKLAAQDWAMEAALQFHKTNTWLSSVGAAARIQPNDALFKQQWYLELMRVPEAWGALKACKLQIQFGSADVLLALHDSGIQAPSGVPIHPEFQGTVSGGDLSAFLGNKNNKIYFMHDFDKGSIADEPQEPGNTDTRNPHGTAVTALAAAQADGITGVAGVAPNVRVLSILGTLNNDEVVIDALQFTGGLQPEWHESAYTPIISLPPFPTPFGQMGNPGPGAHIINCSHTQRGSFLFNSFRQWASRLTHFGRHRRGVLVFAAAGNAGRDTRMDAKWGNDLNIMIVAGSTLDHRGLENSMPGSNYARGLDPAIDFCAPSHSTIPLQHMPAANPNDPNFYGVITAGFVGAGNISGQPDHIDDFGGTSAATPLVSGVAALVLSAKPALTWIEVRQILRETAVPINPKHRGPSGVRKWQDAAQNDLVTNHGLLDLQGPFTHTILPLAAGQTRIVVDDARNFKKRQAILIGAESKLAVDAVKGSDVITLDSASEFGGGDWIIIGKTAETFITKAIPAPGSQRIVVQSVDGFEVGDMLDIGGTRVQITGISQETDSLKKLTDWVAFTISNPDASTPFPPQTAGTFVSIHSSQREALMEIKHRNGNTLELGAKLKADHPKDRIVQKLGTEVRVIQKVNGNELTIDPLRFSHSPNKAEGIIHLSGGRIAFYNNGFGYGRVDAYRAVKAAIEYTHDERDLMLRNFIGDDGKTNTSVQPVHSPDLWLTNDVPTPAAPVLGYAYNGPHETPRGNIGDPVFNGSGVNDLSVHGRYNGPAGEFLFEVTHPGNKITWSFSGGAPETIDILSGEMSIGSRLNIGFGAVTGHKVGDKWTVRVTPPVPIYAHLRVFNRGSKPSFVKSAYQPTTFEQPAPVAQARILICKSNGLPIKHFYGEGTDDLVVTSEYNGTDPAFFSVRIHSPTGSGSFIWSKDAGAASPPVTINGAEQALSHGVKIQFGMTSGHLTGDTWVIKCRPHNHRFISIDHYIEDNPLIPFKLSSDQPGTLLLKRDVPSGQPTQHHIDGLLPKVNKVFHLEWPADNRPARYGYGSAPPPRPMRFFLLGEITPHDGELTGEIPEKNNNFTYREFVFARFQFLKPDGTGEIKPFIEVDSFGTVVTEPIHVDVMVDAGSFAVESLELECEMSMDTGQTGKKIFKFDGTAWAMAGGAPNWLSVTAPTLRHSTTPATGEQVAVTFAVTLNVSRQHKTIVLRPKLYSIVNPDIVLATEERTVPVVEQAQVGGRPGGAGIDLTPRSHFFTDPAALKNQTPEQAYGPVSDSADPLSEQNRYRVTSLFTASGSADAYAVVDGIVLVQRAEDDTGQKTNRVNLVLKPFKQAMLGFTPVKYFIYRGLKLSDFLKGTGSNNEKLVRGENNASPFITKLWALHNQQNPGGIFSSKALGYDPDGQTGTDVLDGFFFRESRDPDEDLQLPYVARGTNLGAFRTTGNKAFGFEIILEEGGSFQPDLTYVRKASHVIDMTEPPGATPFQKRLKREEILNYIDPAVFFGMHRTDKGWLQIDDGSGGKTRLTGAAIYDQVISKFHTGNRVYVDIRNEVGNSYNFFTQYTDSGRDLQIGNTSGSLTDSTYGTHWPIITLDNRAAPVTTGDDHGEIYLRLNKTYNLKPIVYVEHGKLLTPATQGRFIADDELHDKSQTQTLEIGFSHPYHDLAGQKVNSAWLIKLHFGLQHDAANTFPAEVLPNETYLDNLFGPIDIEPLWAGVHPISWLSVQDKMFLDGSKLGFSQMVNRGVAFQSGADLSGTQRERVLFYAAAVESFSTGDASFTPKNGISGGISKRGTFFEEALLFSGYVLGFDILETNDGDITTLRFFEGGEKPRPLNHMLLLGLDNSELQKLDALAVLSDEYPRYLALKEITFGNPSDPSSVFSDQNGQSYRKYKVGVQGFKADGKYSTEYPSDDIVVYTVDQLFLFSDLFSSGEPLPPYYIRNGEESRALRTVQWKQTLWGADPVSKAFLVQGDVSREMLPGTRVQVSFSTANDGTYEVAEVRYLPQTNQSEIVAKYTTPKKQGVSGQISGPEKQVKDYILPRDFENLTGSYDPVPNLVKGFKERIEPLTTVSDLQAEIDLFAPKILERARELCRSADFLYPDDRLLYWARLEMIVSLKSHPELLHALSDRNRLVRSFEEKSRGYFSVVFPANRSIKRVLLTGFDPFAISGNNPLKSNPSGAAVLALHGYELTLLNGSALVQSAVFPTRYRDFEQNGDGSGVVEDFFSRFIDSAHPNYQEVDLIITLSLGSRDHFQLERFASRYRDGTKDNENMPPAGPPAFEFPDALNGKEFYETSLPVTKMVAATNELGTRDIHYDNSFEYVDRSGPKEKTVKYEDKYLGGNLPIENSGHSDHGNFTGLTPAELDLGTTPAEGEIEARKGSGGAFVSNEIFYRVSRLRARHNPNLPTGHLHLPILQVDYGVFAAEFGAAKPEFDPIETKKIIDAIALAIEKALS